MKFRISALAAAALLCGATAAFAQGTSGSVGRIGTSPGAAPNGTTPGAIGSGTQWLQEPSAGTGLGYNPPAPSLGVSPDATGSTTYNPNLPLPPAPGSTGQSTGSAAGVGSMTGSPSGG